MAPNIELGTTADEALAPNNCSKQLEYAFCDPVQRDEWLALLELQRRFETMDSVSEE